LEFWQLLTAHERGGPKNADAGSLFVISLREQHGNVLRRRQRSDRRFDAGNASAASELLLPRW
jgi:hypothetical protein